MLHLPEIAGPHEPRDPAPALRPRTLRRTTTVDTRRPEGLDGPSRIDARARDLLVPADGTLAPLDEAAVAMTVRQPGYTIVSVSAVPPVAGLDGLVDQLIGRGFRRRLAEVLPGASAEGTLLHFLLDDLPGAALVSGYSWLHAGRANDVSGPRGGVDREALLRSQADLCAGWAHDGSMMTTMLERGQAPVPLGPVAPPLPADTAACHPVDPLGATETRRYRRLDVRLGDDGDAEVEHFFRDTHVDPDGAETVVHEYLVEARIDRASRIVRSAMAHPDVLPWVECPTAAASAGRIAGLDCAALRDHVRTEFLGVSTCTHLNDVLRGLADVGPLLDVLEAAAGDGG